HPADATTHLPALRPSGLAGSLGIVPRVARFNITPVKSTALHHPEEIRLGPRGVAGDRAFFLVDANGRRFPGLAKGSLIPIRATYDAEREWLTLRMPDGVEVAGSAL